MVVSEKAQVAEDAALLQLKVDYISVIPEGVSDEELRRWLRARKNNVKQAGQMYERHLEFRKKHDLDNFLEIYKPPELFMKYMAGGECGKDKQGSPILYQKAGCLDVKGCLLSTTLEDVKMFAIYQAELLLSKAKKYSEESGTDISRWIIVVDAEGFGRKQMNRHMIEFQRAVATMLVNNYPDRLNLVLVINYKRVFGILVSILKTFLPAESFEKFKMLKNKEELLDYIDADQLPVCYGGTLVDSNGDPECKEWILPGGTVPEENYKTVQLDKYTEFWDNVKISPGKQFVTSLEVTKENVEIHWEFLVEKSRPIWYGVWYVKEEGQEWLHKIRKWDGKGLNSGSAKCKHPGKYVFVLDNCTSVATSKSVRYTFYVNENVLSSDLGEHCFSESDDDLGDDEMEDDKKPSEAPPVLDVTDSLKDD